MTTTTKKAKDKKLWVAVAIAWFLDYYDVLDFDYGPFKEGYISEGGTFE